MYIGSRIRPRCCSFIYFSFNDTAATEIYTLSLHDALPIWRTSHEQVGSCEDGVGDMVGVLSEVGECRIGPILCQLFHFPRSEEHTSELQSRRDLVCRLLLEKKKKKSNKYHTDAAVN